MIFPTETWLIACLFFFVAALYSSVGHGGGSSYIAVMTLLGFSSLVMKPSALCLNIVVASLAVWHFQRQDCVNFRQAFFFLAGSVPSVFLASQWNVSKTVFTVVLGMALLGSAVRLLVTVREPENIRPPQAAVAVICGFFLGILSGISGIGGGVFLSPLLVQAGWSGLRQASGISALFILVNSIVGLAARQPDLAVLPPGLALWIPAVACGGWIGSQWGSHRLPLLWIRRALALVLLLATTKWIVQL
jgi:uncharacterized membrane protein YfcA